MEEIRHKMQLEYFVAMAILCSFVEASPKKYTEQGGFQPSNDRYYETSLPDVQNTSNKLEQETKESHNRLQRFGIPLATFGSSGNGVGSSYPSGVGYNMTPIKIDIAGIALGALIGLGAILIVPKIAHVFSAGHGFRSLENDMSSVTELLSNIDSSLEKRNIDSSSCVQRIICSYVNEAERNMQKGDANTIDQVIYSVTHNGLFSYMLDGSAIKEAVEMGKQGDLEKCSALYLKCPVSKENVMQIIGSLLPAA